MTDLAVRVGGLGISHIGIDVVVQPGDDIQAAVDAHADGTSFLLKSGTHRYTTNGGKMVIPKNGNAFYGETGTVLSGARVLTSWTVSGGTWYATGQTQAGQTNGFCESPYVACQYPEDVFYDDVPLEHVDTLGEVTTGKWFFDYAADRIYIGDTPSGHLVETSVARHAFVSQATGVQLYGLAIEKFAVPAQYGAVYAADYSTDTLAYGWVVDGCDIRHCHGAAIRTGHEMRVRNTRLHHNGNCGISGLGNSVILEDLEVDHNNYAFFAQGWEAGGIKMAQTNALIMRRIHSHDNAGPGLWCDGNCFDTIIEDNHVHDNTDIGIFYEISWGATKIRRNRSYSNGLQFDDWMYGAQIAVSTSSDCEVYENVVAIRSGGKGHGITCFEQDRGSGAFGTFIGRNNSIHHNDIYYYSEYGQTGGAVDYADPTFLSGGGNLFDYNRYHLPSAASLLNSRWAWGANRDWAGFQAQGHEAHGTTDYTLPTFPPS